MIQGGSRHLHAVGEMGIRTSHYGLRSHDIALMSFGYVTPFPNPMGNFSDMTNARNISFGLWNNIWGTNYPEAYPFDSADTNMKFRIQQQLY